VRTEAVYRLNVCLDQHFSLLRPQFYDPEIVNLAFLTILKHIFTSGDHARHLIDAIAQCAREDAVYFFSGIIGLWVDLVNKQVQEQSHQRSVREFSQWGTRMPGEPPPIVVDKSFYNREKSYLFQKATNVDTALYNVLEFATEAARHSLAVRSSMIDAGALSLVLLAFVNTSFQPPGLMDVSREKGGTLPISSDVIMAGASILMFSMHNPAFREAWRDEPFHGRRYRCSLLVDSLLVAGGEVADRNVALFVLFKKILAS
jgi:hypothetical protein